MTRPDVMSAGLDRRFFDWAIATIKNPREKEFVRLGALRGLNQVYKHGKRDDLLPSATLLLREVVNQEFHKQALALRLMSLKLIQRIGEWICFRGTDVTRSSSTFFLIHSSGLVFLKPRLARWRYRRGCRSLLDSFAASAVSRQSGDAPMLNGFNHEQSKGDDDEDEDEGDSEIPGDVEEVIDQLLMGLKDADSQVRCEMQAVLSFLLWLLED